MLAGDTDAYAEIVARNEAALRRLVVGFLGDAHLAEDVLQEVLWIAYERLSGFQFRARFRTWASRIAVRRALTARTKLRGWVRRLRPMPDPPAAAEDRNDDLEAGLARLRRLPEAERVALVLHAEGYAYHEIAELTGCPIGTVSARIHRARDRLAALGGAAETRSEPPQLPGASRAVGESLRRDG